MYVYIYIYIYICKINIYIQAGCTYWVPVSVPDRTFQGQARRGQANSGKAEKKSDEGTGESERVLISERGP